MRNSKDVNTIDIEFRMTSNLSLQTKQRRPVNDDNCEKSCNLYCHVILDSTHAHYLHIRL